MLRVKGFVKTGIQQSTVSTPTNVQQSNSEWVPAFVCTLSFLIYSFVLLAIIDPNRQNSINYHYTVANDKFSCVDSVFPFHIVCCWFTFFMGAFAICVRLFEFLNAVMNFMPGLGPLNSIHMWFGRAYILGMIWTIASSSLIRNEGLPLGVIVSFLWVLGGLTFGYIMIKLDNSTVWSRSAHAAFMITSWISIAGRIGNHNTKLIQHFTCYTIPVYKTNFSAIPLNDPHYDSLPWANKEIWTWGLLLGPIPFIIMFSIPVGIKIIYK